MFLKHASIEAIYLLEPSENNFFIKGAEKADLAQKQSYIHQVL